MANSDYIEVHIEGKKGVDKLTPDNYDISELQGVLEIISKLSPSKKGDEPLSLRIIDGSVKQVFHSSKQRVAMFATILSLVAGNYYLEDIDPATANAIETIQQSARQQGYTYKIQTSIPATRQLEISPATNYCRKKIDWVEGDFYLYGEVVLTGGQMPKLHINTKEYGNLVVNASREFLATAQNLLYHTCGMLVRGQQNVETNEMNTNDLVLVKMIADYTPNLDLDYLNHCIQKVTANFGGQAGYEEWYNLVKG